MIGRNFFNEIAPCCNKPSFRGVFDAGVRSGHLNAIFDYVFDYKMNPTRVKIQMKAALATATHTGSSSAVNRVPLACSPAALQR